MAFLFYQQSNSQRPSPAPTKSGYVAFLFDKRLNLHLDSQLHFEDDR